MTIPKAVQTTSIATLRRNASIIAGQENFSPYFLTDCIKSIIGGNVIINAIIIMNGIASNHIFELLWLKAKNIPRINPIAIVIIENLSKISYTLVIATP